MDNEEYTGSTEPQLSQHRQDLLKLTRETTNSLNFTATTGIRADSPMSDQLLSTATTIVHAGFSLDQQPIPDFDIPDSVDDSGLLTSTPIAVDELPQPEVASGTNGAIDDLSRGGQLRPEDVLAPPPPLKPHVLAMPEATSGLSPQDAKRSAKNAELDDKFGKTKAHGKHDSPTSQANADAIQRVKERFAGGVDHGINPRAKAAEREALLAKAGIDGPTAQGMLRQPEQPGNPYSQFNSRGHGNSLGSGSPATEPEDMSQSYDAMADATERMSASTVAAVNRITSAMLHLSVRMDNVERVLDESST